MLLSTNTGLWIDIIPGVVTNDKRLDKEKGNNKIFDHYLAENILKEVAGGPTKSPKETLKDELKALGGAPGNKTVEELEVAIMDILEEQAYELGIDPEGLSKDELKKQIAEAGDQ